MTQEEDVDLYAQFNLTSAATAVDIKKSYRKLALLHHPDKLKQDATETEKEAAKENFQKLSLYYSILSDPKKRQRYDATGQISDVESMELDPE
jgi:DnaJ homolog subfamily C member 9